LLSASSRTRASETAELAPGVEIIRVEFDRTTQLLRRFDVALLSFAQVAEQVENLRLIRHPRGETGEDTIRDALSALAAEGPFTAEAMALHPAEAVGHQLVGALIVRLGLGEIFSLVPKVRLWERAFEGEALFRGRCYQIGLSCPSQPTKLSFPTACVLNLQFANEPTYLLQNLLSLPPLALRLPTCPSLRRP
jgi:hypothetical protein